MLHLRRDYDRIQDPDEKIDMAEPVFLLRGQDPVAGYAVKHWAKLNFDRSDRKQDDQALAYLVTRWAAFMSGYAEARKHGPATIDLSIVRTDLLDGVVNYKKYLT